MSPWVVVVSAFGGGLAGAVLQPATQFVLNRIDAGNQRQNRLNRRLRKMIEAELESIEDVLMWAAGAVLTLERGGSIPEDSLSKRLTQRPVGPWQPYRVEDEELRRITESIDQLQAEIAQLMTHPKDATRDGTWLKLKNERDELSKRAALRMDVLRWDVDGELGASR